MKGARDRGTLEGEDRRLEELDKKRRRLGRGWQKVDRRDSGHGEWEKKGIGYAGKGKSREAQWSAANKEHEHTGKSPQARKQAGESPKAAYRT